MFSIRSRRQHDVRQYDKPKDAPKAYTIAKSIVNDSIWQERRILAKATDPRATELATISAQAGRPGVGKEASPAGKVQHISRA